MKIFSISLNKDDVFDDVSINSGYTGAKATDSEETYDRVATIKADEELLSRFWKEGGNILIDKLREFIRTFSLDENKLTLELELSGAFDEALIPSVSSDLHSSAAAGVMAKWFAITAPERCPEYKAEMENSLERAYAKLCQRRKPKRIKL